MHEAKKSATPTGEVTDKPLHLSLEALRDCIEENRLLIATHEATVRKEERERVKKIAEGLMKECPILGAQNYKDDMQEQKNLIHNTALSALLEAMGEE